MKQKIWIGCDPGKDGAIAALYDDGNIIHHVTPRTGKEIDSNQLKNIFLSFIEITETGEFAQDIIVGIEDVHAVQGSGASSAFSFGRSSGILEGIVSALDLPWMKVQPKKWQKTAWEGVPLMLKPTAVKKNSKGEDVESRPVDTKAMSMTAVKRLFPNRKFLANSRCTVDHDGIIDALGICWYLKNTFLK